MPLPKPQFTAEDYWALSDGVRTELIDGELWGLAAPNRKHQEIVHEFDRQLGNFIDAHGGSCKVYPLTVPVPSGIFPGFKMDMARVVAHMP